MPRTKHPRLNAVVAALCLLATTACGTRLSDEQIASEVLAARDGGGQAAADGSSAGGIDGGTADSGTTRSGTGTSPRPGSGRTGSKGSAAGSRDGRGPAGAGEKGDSGGEILIGNVGDYSGLASSSTAGGLRGMQVWVAATNAKGGIGGRKVRMIVADAGGDPQRGKSFVKDFVEDKKVVALVGSFAALSVSGWASYVDEKRVPAVGGDCAAIYWNQHPMLFNQCPATETVLYGILANGAGVAGKGAKWANLYCVESPDLCGKLDRLANEGGYAKKAGLNPVYRAGISLGQVDFTSECLNMRNRDVKAVSVWADISTLQRVARSCAQQNYRPLFLEGGATVPPNAPTSTGLGNMSAAMPALPFAGGSGPRFAEFEAAMKKYGGGDRIGSGEMTGWVAGKLFEDAVKRGGGATTAKILAGLYSMKGNTLGGLSTTLTFAKGKPSPDSRCWFTMQAKGGKWTTPVGNKTRCWSGG